MTNVEKSIGPNTSGDNDTGTHCINTEGVLMLINFNGHGGTPAFVCGDCSGGNQHYNNLRETLEFMTIDVGVTFHTSINVIDEHTMLLLQQIHFRYSRFRPMSEYKQKSIKNKINKIDNFITF